jgi:hypothetical protein
LAQTDPCRSLREDQHHVIAGAQKFLVDYIDNGLATTGRRNLHQQTLRAVGIDGWASPVGLDNAEEDSEIL